MKIRCVLICLPILMAGCGSEGSDPGSESDPNFVSVEHDDAAMETAIQKAKDTFHLFEKNWKSMPNDGYSVKIEMPTGDPESEVEHIWFNPIRIDGDTIEAECANEPVKIPNLAYGDVRTLDRSMISDWMITAGAKCYGGYTIRVLSEKDPANAPPFEFADFEE